MTLSEPAKIKFTMSPAEEEMGKDLRDYNEKIVRCLILLREQRDDLAFLIEKQYEERKKLETELERITYKLCLINKSLGQRVKAKENYDKTIAEIELKYNKLVENSGDLLVAVQKECDELDSVLNKKTSTVQTPIFEMANEGAIIYPPQSVGVEEAPCLIHKDCPCKEKAVSYAQQEHQAEQSLSGSETELPIKLGKEESVSGSSNNSSGKGDDSDDEMGSSADRAPQLGQKYQRNY